MNWIAEIISRCLNPLHPIVTIQILNQTLKIPPKFAETSNEPEIVQFRACNPPNSPELDFPIESRPNLPSLKRVPRFPTRSQYSVSTIHAKHLVIPAP